MNRKKLVALGILFMTALGSSLLLIVKLFREDCRPVAVEPNVKVELLPKMASIEFDTLAIFAGYLKLYDREDSHDPANVFLPLRLESVNVRKTFNDNIRNLTLTTSCGYVSLDVKTKHNLQGIDNGRVGFTLSDGKSIECQITQMNILYDKSYHYDCKKKREYLCVHNEAGGTESKVKLVAELFIEAIEFELDGSPELIKMKEFTRNPFCC